MEQYVFYYQINWDRKRPKHLTSLSERTSPPSRDPNTSKLHPFIYQYSWQGGELYRQWREKSKLLTFSEWNLPQPKYFGQRSKDKVRIFFIGSNRECHYYEDGPGINQWEAFVRECDQWEGSIALTIVQNNEAWNVSSATSVGQLLSYPDRKDKGIVCVFVVADQRIDKIRKMGIITFTGWLRRVSAFKSLYFIAFSNLGQNRFVTKVSQL